MPDLAQRLQEALADCYRIERGLGHRGMATVFLAEDLKHHRQVALNVLDPEVGAAIGPERFLREIETVARLTHPHILPLFDSGQANGLLFYAMPYVEGESLRDRLNREKQLPVDDALRIAREVADALSYAHSLGVVHRDIKPENIVLESCHAVVAKFGIARADRGPRAPLLRPRPRPDRRLRSLGDEWRRGYVAGRQVREAGRSVHALQTQFNPRGVDTAVRGC